MTRPTIRGLLGLLHGERAMAAAPFGTVSTDDIDALRDTRGFVGVHEYGYGCARPGEVGMLAGVRYFDATEVLPMPHWAPP